MPISFQCACGKKMQVPDSAAGKAGKCPSCGNRVTVPAATPATAPVLDAEPAGAPAGAGADAATAPTGPLRASAVQQEENSINFAFQGVKPLAVAAALASFFKTQDYRLEGGEKLSGTYGTGSDVLRLLLGGFAKRSKFNFQIELRGPSVVLTVSKGMSGILGGAIGYSRMKKEMARIFAELQKLFGG